MSEGRKLCWECGAEVPQSATQCPFCGAEFEVEERGPSAPAYGDLFSSDDPAVNQLNQSVPSEESSSAEAPLFQPIDDEAPRSELFSSKELSDESSAEGSDNKEKGARNQLICLCLLIPGFSLLLFALILFFFSQEGYLTLKWDASWGMFVLGLSTLFIYLGAKAYKKL
jgi:hypothetical protein